MTNAKVVVRSSSPLVCYLTSPSPSLHTNCTGLQSLFKHARSLPAQHLRTSCFLCLNTFPPDIHMSLSLLCTLWVTFSERPSTWQNYSPTPSNHHLVSPHAALFFSFCTVSRFCSHLPAQEWRLHEGALFNFVHLTGATQAYRPAVSLWLCSPQAAQWRCFGGEEAGSKLSALSLADSKA